MTARGDVWTIEATATAAEALALMREHGRRFYFDQDAVLVKRFGVQNVPAVVQRADPFMQVEEIALGKGGEIAQ